MVKKTEEEFTEIENKIFGYWHTLAPFEQIEEESSNVRFKVWHDDSNSWAEFMVHFGTDHITVHDYWQVNASRTGQIRALGSWQAMDRAARKLAHYAGPGEIELKKVYYKNDVGGATRVYSF